MACHILPANSLFLIRRNSSFDDIYIYVAMAWCCLICTTEHFVPNCSYLVLSVTGWKSREEYLAYMNAKDLNHNAHFPPRRAFYPLASEPNKEINGQLYMKKKKKRHCNKLCVLVWCLAFFILLSVVMTSLVIWQANRKPQAEANPTIQQVSQCV